MELTSPAFEHNGFIPAKYTCDGEHISPPLNISGIPEGTAALAVIMDDPDVPTSIREDGMWDHWIIFNIPPDVSEIAEGEEPPGVHGLGTADNTEYHGPCPPDGEHRYFFKLYALDTTLDVSERASKQAVEQAMDTHIIEQSELIGRYERS